MNKKKGIERREIFCASSLQIREAAEGAESRTIEGTAIVFGKRSEPLYEDSEMEIREVIAPEAVTRDLLDASTILMTLYHDNHRLLARSLRGKGTLSYDVRSDGVHFSFDAPETEDGRVALEAIRRGDITGCSFAFSVDYSDRTAVERSSETRDGKEYVLYTVKKMRAIHDFTLTPLPAYPQTATQNTRDIENAYREEALEEKKAGKAARERKIAEILAIAGR